MRLKSAYYVTCNSYDTDENGEVTCLHCTYDPESRGGETPDGRKVRGTLHWVSAADNVKAQVRLYDRLFNTENPAGEDGNGDYLQNINPDSLKIIDGCLLEGGLRDAKPGDTFQFMRQGYFCVDKDSTPGNLIINRTVAPNSSWDKRRNKHFQVRKVGQDESSQQNCDGSAGNCSVPRRIFHGSHNRLYARDYL